MLKILYLPKNSPFVDEIGNNIIFLFKDIRLVLFPNNFIRLIADEEWRQYNKLPFENQYGGKAIDCYKIISKKQVLRYLKAPESFLTHTLPEVRELFHFVLDLK